MSARIEASEPKTRTVSICIGLAILAFLFSIITSVLAILGVHLFGPDVENTFLSTQLLPVVASQASFFLTGYLYARWYGLTVPVGSPPMVSVNITVIGAFVALVFAAGIIVAVDLDGLLPNSPPEETIAGSSVVIWIAVLSVFVIAPAKEYLFRGVIQRRLRKNFGAPGAVLGASLLFGPLHIGNISGSLETMLMGTLAICGVGIVYRFLYERTGILVVLIMGHTLYNVVIYAGSCLIS